MIEAQHNRQHGHEHGQQQPRYGNDQRQFVNVVALRCVRPVQRFPAFGIANGENLLRNMPVNDRTIQMMVIYLVVRWWRRDCTAGTGACCSSTGAALDNPECTPIDFESCRLEYRLNGCAFVGACGQLIERPNLFLKVDQTARKRLRASQIDDYAVCEKTTDRL